MTDGEQSTRTIILKNDAIQVTIFTDDNKGGPFLQDVLPAPFSPREHLSPYFEDGKLPLAAVRLVGEGNAKYKTGKSLVGSSTTERLRYKSHTKRAEAKGRFQFLDVEMFDPVRKVTAISHIAIFEGLPIVRFSTSIRNDSEEPIIVTQLSSLVIGEMARSKEWWADYVLSVANNTWFREAQWKDLSLPSIGLDDYGVYELDDRHPATVSFFSLSNRGTFSTQGHLPMGLLKRRDASDTWLWQIENNGSWRWEIGDFQDNIYLAASGPNETDHDWRERLAPGATFTSATAALCHVHDGPDAAFAALTQYRRRITRPHVDHERLPIIFNDYMNCLLGDPTDEKILALLEPVAESGAEYFVIDAGWYADDGNWWDDVGTWEPSRRRFPMGFDRLVDRIRDHGLKPGLWIEPEVIGVRSIMAKTLPADAFFQRDGYRIVEKGRYQLDFRHPAAREWMDGVVDGLIEKYGVTYFKFDYNIEITQGTDVDCWSSGSGQLGHNRAYLSWVEQLLGRHQDLVVENCSSGGQRMDYAMLAVHTLQSTSDQQDPVRYAAIAAAVPTAVLPEQGATWAYPQPMWSDEINALTVVNSLLGRVHLSGRLDLMSADQRRIIHEGMAVYKTICTDLASAVPFWPFGLPAWHDHWLALGMSVPFGSGGHNTKCYVAVWRRGGEETEVVLPIRPLEGCRNMDVQFLYPASLGVEAMAWDHEASALTVTMPKTICARLFLLTPVGIR